MQVAIVDVSYRNNKSRSVCIILNDYKFKEIVGEYSSESIGVEVYDPGSFYKRELL